LEFFRSRKKIIGFDDRWLILFGIPMVSLLVNTLLFGHLLKERAYDLFSGCFPISVYFTSIYWVVFRELYYYMVKKYPLNEDLRKRQAMTIALVFGGYYVIDFFGGLFLYLVLDFSLDDGLIPNPVLKFITSTLFSFLIMTIYESFYLSMQLNKSQIEKEKLFKENISSQLSGLRSQINPHFLFNSLNTLSSLIHEDPARADQFVTKLSKVYRHVLENNDETIVTLKEELTYLRAYIHLLKERFGDNLVYEENIDSSQLNKYIVPLSLQITFENCVKHNISTKENPLRVALSIHENRSYICIANNIQELVNKDESTSVGLDNIRRRYAYFSDLPIEVINDGITFKVCMPLLDENKLTKSI
jgi:sensor histidine kinase YesM